MLFKSDVIIIDGCLFHLKFLFLNIQFCGYIHKNIHFNFIAGVLYFFRIQILLFNLNYQVEPIMLRKLCLQIIDLSKTLIIYAKSNDMSLDNSFKKIVTDMEIFNLYTYSFLSQYAVKLLKQIMIL